MGGRYGPGESGGRNAGATDMAWWASENVDTACKLHAAPPDVARSTRSATVRACASCARAAAAAPVPGRLVGALAPADAAAAAPARESGRESAPRVPPSPASAAAPAPAPAIAVVIDVSIPVVDEACCGVPWRLPGRDPCLRSTETSQKTRGFLPDNGGNFLPPAGQRGEEGKMVIGAPAQEPRGGPHRGLVSLDMGGGGRPGGPAHAPAHEPRDRGEGGGQGRRQGGGVGQRCLDIQEAHGFQAAQPRGPVRE